MSRLSHNQSSVAEAFFLTSGNHRSKLKTKEAADTAMGQLLVLVKTHPEKFLSMNPKQFEDPDVRDLLVRLQRQADGTIKRREHIRRRQTMADITVDRRTAAVLQS